MSDDSTKKMLAAYDQTASLSMFLSGRFRSRAEDFYDSETIEIDVMREGEAVAVPIASINTTPHKNEAPQFTNKEFRAPVLDEEFALNSFDLIKRVAGDDPFMNRSFLSRANTLAMRSMRLIENKIRRNIELQAAQILQTGMVTLIDSNADVVFEIDYLAKASHLRQVTSSWSNVAAPVVEDLDALGDAIRTDGQAEPTDICMGISAYKNFLNSDVINGAGFFDTRRANQGSIERMQTTSTGGKLRGTLDIGQYQYNLWTYDGRYDAPDTGLNTPFMNPNFVIMWVEGADLRATFGSIPQITAPDPRVRGILGGAGRVSSARRRMDLSRNVWTDARGRTVHFSAGTRPLLIPTAIDRIGSLNTVQA